MNWKDVEGYEECYQVSDSGEVKRIKTENSLLQHESNRKYLRVTLSKNGKYRKFSVHRLVAIAFIENPNNLPQVNHKDGDVLNNSASNLEWCTQSENQKHAFRTGLQLPVKGESHGNCKLTDEEVIEIRSLYSTGMYT
jgi:hypothetical protein